MRKQYYFRTSERGLLARDVDKLIRLTVGLKPVEIPLNAIRELDEPYWYELRSNTPTSRSIADHMRLTVAVDLAHPIIICPEGRVMDGMHRVVKALLEGWASLPAYRLPSLPDPDHVGVDPDDLPYDGA